MRKLKYVMAGVLIVVANQAVNYAVSAAVPSAVLPPGSTTYAVAKAADHISTFNTVYSNVKDMSVSITIPAGKHGDVMILFCGQASSSATLTVRALVAGKGASPGPVIFHEGSPFGSNCAAFYKVGVGEGTKTVKIQWKTFTSSVSDMFARSMIVTVNVH
jgi:hypothetical protein